MDAYNSSEESTVDNTTTPKEVKEARKHSRARTSKKESSRGRSRSPLKERKRVKAPLDETKKPSEEEESGDEVNSEEDEKEDDEVVAVDLNAIKTASAEATFVIGNPKNIKKLSFQTPFVKIENKKAFFTCPCGTAMAHMGTILKCPNEAAHHSKIMDNKAAFALRFNIQEIAAFISKSPSILNLEAMSKGYVLPVCKACNTCTLRYFHQEKAKEWTYYEIPYFSCFCSFTADRSRIYWDEIEEVKKMFMNLKPSDIIIATRNAARENSYNKGAKAAKAGEITITNLPQFIE